MRDRFVALVLCCSVGCSTSHRPADAAIDASADDALAGELVDALCQRALRCQRAALPLADWSCSPRWREALERGELEVDRTAARACIDGLRALPCVFRSQRPFGYDARQHPRALWPADDLQHACEAALVQTRSQCGDVQCARGERCLIDASCHGTCVALPSEGEPCERELGCRSPAWCRTATETGVCTADCGVRACLARGLGHDCVGDDRATCLDAPAIGEPCAILPDGSTACEAAGVCDPASGLCRARPQIGEPCDPMIYPSLCELPLVCDFDRRECASGARDPCRSSSDCDPGAYCHADGACSTDPEGGQCDVFLWPWITTWSDSCPEGHACDHYSDGHCRPIVPAGGACSPLSVCAEGTVCTDARCASFGDPFARCASADDCPDAWTCEASTCRAPHGRCATEEDCFGGRCVSGLCYSIPPGSPCVDGDACDASCVDGTCAEPGTAGLGAECTRVTDDICAAGLRCAEATDGTFHCCPL